jgi:hypothetical protein
MTNGALSSSKRRLTASWFLVLVLIATMLIVPNAYGQRVFSNNPSGLSMIDQSFPGTGCDYHECSLHLRQRFFVTDVTRGEKARSIGRLGLFKVPDIDGLMNEAPSSAKEWKSSGRQYTRASTLVWAGGIVAIAAAGISAAQGGQLAATSISAAGFVAIGVGLWNHELAMKRLRHALSSYNTTLRR